MHAQAHTQTAGVSFIHLCAFSVWKTIGYMNPSKLNNQINFNSAYTKMSVSLFPPGLYKCVCVRALGWIFTSFMSRWSLAYLHHEAPSFPAGPHARWDNCTVKHRNLVIWGECHFKIHSPYSSEQPLFHLKILHLSKKVKIQIIY
jgi:hypothetical protein